MLVATVIALVVAMAHARLTSEEMGAFYNDANVALTQNGTSYMFTSTGMPDHATELVNPNQPTPQNYMYEILETPLVLPTPGCLPMGVIGFAANGVAFFNPYQGGGLNAVEGDEAEVFDSCDGHPSPTGEYHYHKRPSSCLVENMRTEGQDDIFLGVALDGHAIYTTSSGNQDGLDECNGKLVRDKYRYYATHSFPYLLGCFKGMVIEDTVVNPVGNGMGPPAGGMRPPPGGDGMRPPPPPGGGGMRPPPGGGGMGQNCFFANVTNPSSTEDLTVGDINNGVSIDEIINGDSDGVGPADQPTDIAVSDPGGAGVPYAKSLQIIFMICLFKFLLGV